MPKFIPKTIQNLENQNTVVSSINYNFEALQVLIDTLLSRDGNTPNTMQSFLDMNNNRILNLPVPVSPTEPARHGDIQQYVDLSKYWAEYSEDQADRAEREADDAENSAQEAADDLAEFQSEYLGAFPSDPVLDKNGNLIQDGAFYYNSTEGVIKVYSVRRVLVDLDTVIAGSFNVYADTWVTLPVPAFQDLEDVDMAGASVGDFFQWSGYSVVPVTLTADHVLQSNAFYNGISVQTALDDILDRTSLGIYDVFIFAQGLPGNDEEIIRINASRTFYLPVNAGLSTASLRVPPSGGSAVFTIRKNGTSVGTVTFADASNSGVFSVPGEVTYNQGDVLSLTAPSTVNLAVRDLAITLACMR